MRRWLLNLGALASLLAAIGLVGLWGRSVWYAGDEYWFHHWHLESWGGRVEVDLSGPDRDISLVDGHHRSWPPKSTRWKPVNYWFPNGLSVVGTADWVILAICMVMPTAWMCVARRNRRQRGLKLCRHCGYDLRGSPTGGACPECGAAQSSISP